MPNCLFCFPDYTLGSSTYPAALSGGSWDAGFPLTNLKNSLRSKVARSVDAAAASTKCIIDMGAVRTVRAVAILNHNATANLGTVRYRFCSDAACTNLVYDTGAVKLIDTANLTAEDLVDWRPDFWLALPAAVSARYCELLVDDHTNPLGFFEMGRCCLFGGWSPGVNISVGWSIVYKDDYTRVGRLVSGTKAFDKQPGFRSIEIELKSLTPNEAHASWLEMQRKLGISGELFFITDPAETDFFIKQQSFLGTFVQPSALVNPYFNNFSTRGVLEEIVDSQLPDEWSVLWYGFEYDANGDLMPRL